jgi:hypothetical protein
MSLEKAVGNRAQRSASAAKPKEYGIRFCAGGLDLQS